MNCVLCAGSSGLVSNEQMNCVLCAGMIGSDKKRDGPLVAKGKHCLTCDVCCAEAAVAVVLNKLCDVRRSCMAVTRNAMVPWWAAVSVIQGKEVGRRWEQHLKTWDGIQKTQHCREAPPRFRCGCVCVFVIVCVFVRGAKACEQANARVCVCVRVSRQTPRAYVLLDKYVWGGRGA